MPRCAPKPPPQDALHQERVLGRGGLEVKLALWRMPWGLGYRLECLRGAGALVRYESLGERRHRRAVRGRAAAYEFRSVEQLRYDFERDVAEALA